MDRVVMEEGMRACESLDLASLDLFDDAFFRDLDAAEDAAGAHSLRYQWERPLSPGVRAAHQTALDDIEQRETQSEGELSRDALYTSHDRFADHGAAGDIGDSDDVVDGLSFSDLEAIDGFEGSFLGTFAGCKADEGFSAEDEGSSPCSPILEELSSSMEDSHRSDQSQSSSSVDLAVLLDELERDQGIVEAPQCLDSLKAEADEMFSLLPELDLTEDDFLVLFSDPTEPTHPSKAAHGAGGGVVEGLPGRAAGSGAASALLSPALRTAVARAALKSAKAKLSRGRDGGGHDQAFLKVAAAFEAATMAGAAAPSSSGEPAEDPTELAAAAVRRALEERFPVWTKLISIRHQQPQRGQALKGSRTDPQGDLRARIRRLLLPDGAKGPIQAVEASSKTCLKDRLRQCASKENLSMIKSSTAAAKGAKRSFGESSMLTIQLNASATGALGFAAPMQEASQPDQPKKSMLGASSLQPILDLAAKRRRLDASLLAGMPPAHAQAHQTGPGMMSGPTSCEAPRSMPQDGLVLASAKAGRPLSPAKAGVAGAAVAPVGLDPGRRTLLLAAANKAAGKEQPDVRAPAAKPVEGGFTGGNQRLEASSQMQASAAVKMEKKGIGRETRAQLFAAAARTGAGRAKPEIGAVLQGAGADLAGTRLPQDCSLSARLATQLANQLRRR